MLPHRGGQHRDRRIVAALVPGPHRQQAALVPSGGEGLGQFRRHQFGAATMAASHEVEYPHGPESRAGGGTAGPPAILAGGALLLRPVDRPGR